MTSKSESVSPSEHKANNQIYLQVFRFEASLMLLRLTQNMRNKTADLLFLLTEFRSCSQHRNRETCILFIQKNL